MIFHDSNSQPLTLTFRHETHKGWFGRTSTTTHLKITKDSHWAEFNAADFDIDGLNDGVIAESDTGSEGPVFITNVRFAEPGTLFAEQTQGTAENLWVMIFTHFEQNNVQAVFTDDRFEALVELIQSQGG